MVDNKYFVTLKHDNNTLRSLVYTPSSSLLVLSFRFAGVILCLTHPIPASTLTCPKRYSYSSQQNWMKMLQCHKRRQMRSLLNVPPSILSPHSRQSSKPEPRSLRLTIPTLSSEWSLTTRQNSGFPSIRCTIHW